MSELEKKIDWIVRVLTYELKQKEEFYYAEERATQRQRLLNQAPEVDYHLIEEDKL
jgi:hypothetical protein